MTNLTNCESLILSFHKRKKKQKNIEKYLATVRQRIKACHDRNENDRKSGVLAADIEAILNHEMPRIVIDYL